MDRKKQNQALRDFNELEQRIESLRPLILAVLVRASGDSDLRRSVHEKSDPEKGTPPPYYADPTGESAMRKQFSESVETKVSAIADHLHYAVNLAKNLLDTTPLDVVERAKRTIPDCTVCGDPISGKVFYGRWDEKCRSKYRRWVDAGNYPDRDQFEVAYRTDMVAEVAADWRVDAIETLQDGKALPTPRLTIKKDVV